MKTRLIKHIRFSRISLMHRCLLVGLLLNFNLSVFCQPLPGDLGLGTSSGGVVGGGAPLNPALGLMILLPIIYLIMKYISFQKIKSGLIRGLFSKSMRNNEAQKKLFTFHFTTLRMLTFCI